MPDSLLIGLCYMVVNNFVESCVFGPLAAVAKYPCKISLNHTHRTMLHAFFAFVNITFGKLTIRKKIYEKNNQLNSTTTTTNYHLVFG